MQISIRIRVVKLLQRYMLEKDIAFRDLCTTLCMLSSFVEVDDLFNLVDLDVNEALVLEVCQQDDIHAIIDVLQSAAGVLLCDEAFMEILHSVLDQTDDLRVYSILYSIALLRFRKSGNKKLLPSRNDIVMKLIRSSSAEHRDTGHRLAVFADLPFVTKLSLVCDCLKGNSIDKQTGLYVLGEYLSRDEIRGAVKAAEFAEIMQLLKRLAALKGKNAKDLIFTAAAFLKQMERHVKESGG